MGTGLKVGGQASVRTTATLRLTANACGEALALAWALARSHVATLMVADEGHRPSVSVGGEP